MHHSSSNIARPLAPLALALLLCAGLFAILPPLSAPAAPGYTPPQAQAIFQHLEASKRLHVAVASPDALPGALFAPDGNWIGGAEALNGPLTTTQALALRRAHVALFRASVQDSQGQDVAWENAFFEAVLQNTLDDALPHTVLTETQVISGGLQGVDLLILPAFRADYAAQVVAALGPQGLAALADFVQQGGAVYAQGTGTYLLEAAGVLPAGTVDLAHPLQLPPEANDLGSLHIDDPTHLLSFNWQSGSLWMLDDPALHIAAPLQTIASYSNTLGGPQPAVAYGEVGQGRVMLVAGHSASTYHPEQISLFVDAILAANAERGELYGRAIQTYDPAVGPTVIPAYEANIPISATLCVAHLWQGATLAGAQVVERVQAGFLVDPLSVSPVPASLVITSSGGVTQTIITWELGDLTETPACLSYQALTERDALAEGIRTFSQGELRFAAGPRQVTWAHPDFQLSAILAARLVGQHDKEPDRFYHLPAEGLDLDEFIFLENKEESFGYNLHAQRYIPLIVPIVGLEDQRKPLHTNDGQTIWMYNELFMFENGAQYPLPLNLSSYTDTLNLEDWDGQTFITMTTPGGYHIDPPPTMVDSLVDGFFVTIPPTYTYAITVTADHKLLLPAVLVEWELGDFPGFWYEMPAVRYGIHSREIFSRSVSFTGDPLVGSLVADSTGGSVYTGLGTDPRLYREYLTEVLLAPPQVPSYVGLTYQDVWSRTHELSLRAGFYDLFSYAGCPCSPWYEAHQRLNVTFGVWIDQDGDGIREKLITEFAELPGVMPTRVVGDLDILIKTHNLATYGIEMNENILEGRIFRGLGFQITPRYGDWQSSVEISDGQLISQSIDGAYDVLLFRQGISANDTNQILIHATVDATPRALEGLLKLHDGVRFVYRQGFAGPNQYEVHDTHVQGVIGARSDAVIDSQVIPAHLSTYSDTFFSLYDLSDLYDRRDDDDQVSLESWGYGDTAATTYVGGRDGRTLLYSLVTLGERTWLRVEVNNNSGQDWSNVQVTPQPPAGITVTRLFTQNAPLPMWPDLPFLNLTAIPDVAYGIYYFELQTDPAAAELLGQVVRIPIHFQADGAPANFRIAPATLAIRDAQGNPPRYSLSQSHDLLTTDIFNSAITPLGMRLLTQQQRDHLWQLALQDALTIPETHQAISYFASLTSTIPFSFTQSVLQYTTPVDGLPWVIGDLESSVYAVSLNSFTGTRATRYQVNAGAVLTSTDSFGMQWVTTAAPDFIEASGATLEGSYLVQGMTRTLTGEAIQVLYAGEDNQARIEFRLTNAGNDVAAKTRLLISLPPDVLPLSYPAQITPVPGGLEWQVGDLAPGVQRSAQVVLQIHPHATLWRTLFQPTAPQAIWGYVTALNGSQAEFINVYSGQPIQAHVADRLQLPYGNGGFSRRLHLPKVHKPLVFPPIQISSAIPERPITSVGETFFTQQIIVPLPLPPEGHFYFSSQPNQLAPAMVDDVLVVLLNGVEVFRYEFSVNANPPVPAIVELPRSVLEQANGQPLTIEYRDKFGVVVEASPVWLVWAP